MNNYLDPFNVSVPIPYAESSGEGDDFDIIVESSGPDDGSGPENILVTAESGAVQRVPPGVLNAKLSALLSSYRSTSPGVRPRSVRLTPRPQVLIRRPPQPYPTYPAPGFDAMALIRSLQTQQAGLQAGLSQVTNALNQIIAQDRARPPVMAALGDGRDNLKDIPTEAMVSLDLPAGVAAFPATATLAATAPQSFLFLNFAMHDPVSKGFDFGAFTAAGVPIFNFSSGFIPAANFGSEATQPGIPPYVIVAGNLIQLLVRNATAGLIAPVTIGLMGIRLDKANCDRHPVLTRYLPPPGATLPYPMQQPLLPVR